MDTKAELIAIGQRHGATSIGIGEREVTLMRSFLGDLIARLLGLPQAKVKVFTFSVHYLTSRPIVTDSFRRDVDELTAKHGVDVEWSLLPEAYAPAIEAPARTLARKKR